MSQSFNDRLLIGLFVLAITVPAIFGLAITAHPNPVVEKARLAALPSLPQNTDQWRNFPDQLEEYYREHFGFRFRLLAVYRHLKYFMGDPPAQTALFGRARGWIFYDDHDRFDVIGDYRNINQFSEVRLDRLVEQLQEKQRWLAQRGIEYLFVIAPSKHYIYPEQLPAHLTRLDQANLTEQLAERLEQHPDIPFLDLTPVLKQAAAVSDHLLYYTADTHWNLRGGNVAQHAIAKFLQPRMDVTPRLWANSEFTDERVHEGDLALYMGLGSYFAEPRPTPQLPACVETFNPPRTFQRQTFSTSCPMGRGTAMIFRDSFFTNVQPFISTYFEQATFVWEKLDPDTMSVWFQDQQPDVVIEEWVDRHLPNMP